MISPQAFYDRLEQAGVNFVTGVPDSLLKDFCTFADAALPVDRHIIAANEGGAVALAAGTYLATQGISLVYLQNSGLGNTVNPLLSLADSEVYGIPMILLIGWRGEPNVHDEPQHVKQGLSLIHI
jgi:phosphonopyruvate decarboxylase